MNSIENTIRNKDITTLDPNEIQSLFTNPTTSNTIKQFIALYKQLPFKMYIEQNILPNKKSKAKKGSSDVLDVLNFQTEPEYSFLFQVVMIEDITKSTSSQVESLLEIITGEVQYADRINKKDGPTKRKVKELSKVDEIENNGDGDTSVLLENDITNVSNSAKDLTLKITLQDKTGAYYYCYTNPDKGGIVPLVELVNFGCVPICKKILGIKVVLKNFTFNRGVIILQKSQQIVTLARTSIPSWNENFYSKMIHFWKNSLETRNSALSKTLDRKEAGEKRKYHESRA